MNPAVALVNRIETDLAKLKTLIVPATAKPGKNAKGDKIPTIKASYTVGAAVRAKAQIDDAFADGLITYDKRRGLKMLVTKHTEGWSPT